MKTLDDAITHYSELAGNLDICRDCADNAKQARDWLIELKEYRLGTRKPTYNKEVTVGLGKHYKLNGLDSVVDILNALQLCPNGDRSQCKCLPESCSDCLLEWLVKQITRHPAKENNAELERRLLKLEQAFRDHLNNGGPYIKQLTPAPEISGDWQPCPPIMRCEGKHD